MLRGNKGRPSLSYVVNLPWKCEDEINRSPSLGDGESKHTSCSEELKGLLRASLLKKKFRKEEMGLKEIEIS